MRIVNACLRRSNWRDIWKQVMKKQLEDATISACSFGPVWYLHQTGFYPEWYYLNRLFSLCAWNSWTLHNRSGCYLLHFLTWFSIITLPLVLLSIVHVVYLLILFFSNKRREHSRANHWAQGEMSQRYAQVLAYTPFPTELCALVTQYATLSSSFLDLERQLHRQIVPLHGRKCVQIDFSDKWIFRMEEGKNEWLPGLGRLNQEHNALVRVVYEYPHHLILYLNNVPILLSSEAWSLDTEVVCWYYGRFQSNQEVAAVSFGSVVYFYRTHEWHSNLTMALRD